MSAYTPARNPEGQNLGPEGVLLQRAEQPVIDIVATFQGAFETIKTYPAETVGGMVLVMFIVGVINIGLSIVSSLITAALVAIFARDGGGGDGVFWVIQAISFGIQLFTVAIVTVISSVLMGAYNILWLRAVRGEEVSFNHMMEVKPFIVPLVLTSLLMQFAIMVGYAFLIIPGIFLALGLSMTQFVVVDKNLNYVDALKASWAITDGYKLQVFLFGLLGGVLNVIGFIPCGIGLFLTVPMTLGALVSFYDQIAVPGRAYAESDELVGAFE